MSQCQTTPTATQFGTFTTDSLSTSATEGVSTIPASVTTIEQTICATPTGSVTGGAGSGCSTTQIVSTLTPEQVVTTTIPVVVTVPITATSPTATLFGTVCSDGGGGVVTPSGGGSSSSSSSSTSISTLPPTTSLSLVSSTSTLPGGSVTVVVSTATAVVTPTTAVPVPAGYGSKSNSNLGAIIGGVVGGVGGLAVLLLIVWFIMRRRRKARDDDFDDFEGKWPMPVKRAKSGKGNLTLDDPTTVPTPFESYAQGATSGSSHAEGVSAAVAGVPTTANVRKRNPTSSDGIPNPWSSATSSEGYNRAASPQATTEGSVLSSGLSSGHTGSYVPLHVQNPNPGFPTSDVKNPQVYLSADQGTQVYGGQPSSSATSSAGPSGSSTSYGPGSSSAPFVHQDAGVVPGAAQPRRTKQAEAHDDAQDHVDAPPAYEA